MRLFFRRLAAWWLNRFYPGYGTCGRCQRNWKICQYHNTDYVEDESSGHGCFPLCEACWQELTIEQRLPYYRALWQEWNDQVSGIEEPETLALMEQAVREGR